MLFLPCFYVFIRYFVFGRLVYLRIICPYFVKKLVLCQLMNTSHFYLHCNAPENAIYVYLFYQLSYKNVYPI